MYIIAVYHHSLHVELAIAELEEQGFEKEKILAVPLTRQQVSFGIFDTLKQTDGVSLLGGALAFGTACMVLGTIYGFTWYWGPILWGLIGFFAGSSLWLVLSIIYWQHKQAHSRITREKSGSDAVMLMIRCEKPQAELVKNIVLGNMALAIGILER